MGSNEGYEIHSILEFGDVPTPGLWWVLSPNGKSPSIRAGAGSLLIGSDKYDQELVITGGATPAGFINQATKLDLIKGEWRQLETSGFDARYEHAMCMVDGKLTVLLGTGNGSIKGQSYSGEKWHDIDTFESISTRTVAQHGQFGDETFIWSGGCANGAITDNCLYIIKNGVIRKEKLCGELPSPRQEFGFCADDKYLYIHGGIGANGQKLDDLYKVSLSNFRSKKLSIEGGLDMTRAMHKITVHKDTIYLFGGLLAGDQGIISDELIKMSPVEGRNAVIAERVPFETKPTPRIAFNFHIVRMPVRKQRKVKSTTEESKPGTSSEPVIEPLDDWKVTIDGENVALPDTGDAAPSQSTGTVDPSELESMSMILLHGGCDSEGEFFNDIFVSTIP